MPKQELIHYKLKNGEKSEVAFYFTAATSVIMSFF